jgi:selenocysteine-specific elongation factor
VFAGDAPFGLPLRRLALLTGESEATISESAPAAILRFNDWFLHKERAEVAIKSCVSRLSEFHEENPLAGGVSKEELRSKFFVKGPPAVCDALLSGCDQLEVTGDVVGLKAHKVVLRADEDDAVSRIERAFEDGGLAVPAVAEVLQNCGVALAKARTLLQLLLKDRRLVRVSDDLVYHPQAIDRLRNLLHGHRGRQFSVAEFKEWTGVSRKYAIPLLEFLDRERVTRRNGDQRLVL